MASKGHSRSLMVAAIDFGTTFSGYAFSTVYDFEKDPTQVRTNSWFGGALISLKTPTCVLFDPRKEFNAFGFEAEDRYTELSYEQEHKDWYYFRRFKMDLYGTKRINRHLMLVDECKKEMPAIDVFAAGIEFLKEHLLKSCSHFEGLEEEDIKWVLTVPAIWDDSAKQFMREAAENSGIPGHRLVLALEPEAASMYCKHLPVERLLGSSGQVTCFQPGSRYMVLDAGGGTIDITVHGVMKNNKLKEIYKANGGPWGGTTIDEDYIGFLKNLIGDEVVEDFRELNKDEYIDLIRDFEIRKRTAKPDMDQKINFHIPTSLYEMHRAKKGKELREVVRQDPEMREKITFAGDKLRMVSEVMLSFFKRTNENIVNHLRGILQQPEVKGTNSILMVGGFSESPMIQHAVTKAFQNMRIIIPHDAGLAVLKGAVIFGHDGTEITERVCKYTYGLKVRGHYDHNDPNNHPKSRVKCEDGRTEIHGVFSKIVEVGQSVQMNEPCAPKIFQPHVGYSGFPIKLYASPKKDPQYVDEEGSLKIGEVHVDCRDKRGNVAGAEVSLVFGGTELEVRARHCKSGEETRAKFDFLEEEG